MLLLSDDFINICQGATIYLDTNIFIYAQEQEDLLLLFRDLSDNHNTAFLTLSSVEYEYSRGSQSLSELRARREFIHAITRTVMPVGKLLESDKNDVFSAVMSIVVGKKNSDYTDYLLATALHTFNNGIDKQFVLSADARAFPMSLFDISGVVSMSLSKGEVIHLNLIALNKERYGSIMEKVDSLC